MRRWIIIFLIVGILIGSNAKGQEPAVPDTVQASDNIRVETAVDKSEIYIGDLIKYTLTIYHDTGLTLTPPPIGANLGSFDVKDYEIKDPVLAENNRYKIESNFKLTTFTTGDYIIPPIPIEYMLSDSTVRVIISEPISIRVKSLIGDGAVDSLDIRDLKAQYSFEESNLWLWLILGGIVLLGAAVGYWLWRRKKRPGETGEPVDLRDPWEIAFEKLANLREKDYLENEEFKQYYVELSDILRAYIGRIYGFNAPDMTTDEILFELEEIELEPALYDRIRKFMMHADLVKFAKLIPEENRPETDFEEVHEMVTYIREIEMTKHSEIAQVENVPEKEESGV